MKQSVPRWQLAGFLFTSVLGTFLHFLFDLTGGSTAAALFSAVNESIWEHIKLIYYPMLVFALLQWRAWGRENEGFWCAKLKGMLLALALIPALYYTYTGSLGVSADWFNVTIFFLTAAAAFYTETVQLRDARPCRLKGRTAFGLLLALGALFIWFTFSAPRIPLFQDPVTGIYGFPARQTGTLTNRAAKNIIIP